MPFTVAASGSITGPGDVAIIGFNADGDDNIAFVLLGDTTANQVIYFTDNEWNGQDIGDGGAFNSGEGFITWTAPASALPAGTVIEISKASTTTPSVTQGSVNKSGSFNLSGTNEVLYVYLGTDKDTPTAFLTAFANNDYDDNGDSDMLNGTGLTEGVDAIRFDSKDADADIAAYTGSRNDYDTAADYLAQIMNTDNWVSQDGSGDQSNDGTSPDVPFDTTPFEQSNAVTFTRLNTSQGPSNTTIILVLVGFSILLFGGFWLRRRNTN